MTDILAWLEKQTRPREMTPEYREALSKMSKIQDMIGNRTDLKLDAELGAALADIADVQYSDGFTRGFRLGVQLFSAATLAR